MTRLALLLAVCACALTPSRSAAGPIYLALGDSSAFGETDRTRNPSDGDRGYVSRFADHLARRYGVRPQVLNLALNGETTASWQTGTGRASSDGHLLNTNYSAPYPAQKELFRA